MFEGYFRTGEVGEGDFTIDEKQKQVYLTEDGMAHVEELMAKSGLLKEEETILETRPSNRNIKGLVLAVSEC